MLANIIPSTVLFAAFAAAIPAPQPEDIALAKSQRPPPPEAALRPLWVEGTKPTRPQPIIILPNEPFNETEADLESTDLISISATLTDKYSFWNGDGRKWPKTAAWGSFDQLWKANLPLMRQSCGWNGWGANNNQAELDYMYKAIKQVAKESGLEWQFIFNIIMQESGGCVRVATTNNGVRNPGLMQSHNGAGTCYGKNPCPNSQILQMIRDGSSGTKSGDGLKQCLAKTKKVITNFPSRAVFAAARLYNSGSVDYNNLNNGFTSKKCYACDVANRFTGWTYAARRCS